jgi:hypothetical protein
MRLGQVNSLGMFRGTRSALALATEGYAALLPPQFKRDRYGLEAFGCRSQQSPAHLHLPLNSSVVVSISILSPISTKAET